MTRESFWRLEESKYLPYIQEGEERGSEELQGSPQFLGKWCINWSWRPFPGVSRTRRSLEVGWIYYRDVMLDQPDSLLWWDHLLHKWRWIKGCLDFKKPFEADSHNILIHELIKHRLDIRTMRWIERWLNSQAQRIVISALEATHYCNSTPGVKICVNLV